MKMTEYIDLINKKIDEFMPICYPQKIFKSMKYTVTLPGKRLRPVMCLETCRMFGGNYEDAIPTACAIEMLHKLLSTTIYLVWITICTDVDN